MRVIELEHVEKVYRLGDDVSVSALRGVSFTVMEGEFAAIMGESGSGKTTLLGILGCLDRPTAGTYRLVGDDVSTLHESRRAIVRRTRIGFVFQAYNLLPKATAYRNVELPLVYARVPRRDRRDRVIAALAQVGLSDRASHLPTQLSGGQQQRVAIARAIVARPSLVLADEPTGNLDTANAEEILTLFEQLNAAGTTIVLVTHSLEVGNRCSRIIHLADGLLASDRQTGRAPLVPAG